MKKIFCIIILSLSVWMGNAETAQQLFEKGNRSYEQKDYTTAIKIYEDLLNKEYYNASVYYNLGNAYFRANQLGKAILNYERALRIDPTDKETKENLEFAESKTQDKIVPIPKFFLKRWYNSILSWFSPNGWRVATILLLAIALASLVLMRLGKDYSLRKWGFIGLIILGMFTIFSFSNASIATHRIAAQKEAIVMPTMISIKSSPDIDGMEKFILHEGTKVSIEEELNGWLQISIADGNKGWVMPNEIERI